MGKLWTWWFTKENFNLSYCEKSKICITLSVNLKNFLSKKFNKKFYVVKMVFLLNGKKKTKKKGIMREKYLIYVSNYLSHKNHLSLLKFQNYLIINFIVGKPTEATGKKTLKKNETLKKNKIL